MAKCKFCNQEMKDGVSCLITSVKLNDGKEYKRITDHFDEPDGYCHDCKSPHGGIHHVGCDVEKCPKCGGQLLSCNC